MDIQLVQGQFSGKDALEIITKLIEVKIKYHEEKIKLHENEEDLKFRESKIIRLQNELQETRKFLLKTNNMVSVESTVRIFYK